MKEIQIQKNKIFSLKKHKQILFHFLDMILADVEQFNV